jgi:glycosyltransferase involved in cell wall biosynthesis
VIHGVRRRVGRCIVVDDGSTDETAVLAKRAGAELIIHASNRGKGAAVRSALACLRGTPFSYAVLLDADGQHDPAEIPRFCEAARRHDADMVLGTRMHAPAGMPWLRRITNRTMSRIISGLCGVPLTDTQCGYRLLSRRAVERMRLTTSNFEVESEMLLDATRQGLTITEVPVRSIYGDDHTSHIRPVRDTIRFLRLVSKLMAVRLLGRGARDRDKRPKPGASERGDAS